MARVGRLAGALLAETGGRYFLVGNPKEPCDFVAAGFADPGVIDAIGQPHCELRCDNPVELGGRQLSLDVDAKHLPELLVSRLVIPRNASVSERLWRLVARVEDDDIGEIVDAQWLAQMPDEVWGIVTDSVLRCL